MMSLKVARGRRKVYNTGWMINVNAQKNFLRERKICKNKLKKKEKELNIL